MQKPKIGDRFGLLEIVDGPFKIQRKKCYNIKWKCKCDCGRVLDIYETLLKNKGKKCCGCTKKFNASQFKIGMKFGELTIIGRNHGSHSSKIWKTECGCGLVKDFSSRTLTKSKHCSKNCILLKNVKIGDKFNYLTLIGYSDFNQQGNPLYKCKCDCGNIVPKIGYTLFNGITKSCGCHFRMIKPQQTYGFLTSVCKNGKESKLKEKTIWDFVCVCGKNITLPTRDVYNKENISCGCKDPVNQFAEITYTYFMHIQAAAASRYLKFDITPQDIINTLKKQNNKCNLSGFDIYFAKTNKEFRNGRQTASVDRVDSKDGYNVNNIQIVHKDINKMKMDLTQDRFIEFCVAVAKNQNCS